MAKKKTVGSTTTQNKVETNTKIEFLVNSAALIRDYDVKVINGEYHLFKLYEHKATFKITLSSDAYYKEYIVMHTLEDESEIRTAINVIWSDIRAIMEFIQEGR